jgi:hypothetical protein
VKPATALALFVLAATLMLAMVAYVAANPGLPPAMPDNGLPECPYKPVVRPCNSLDRGHWTVRS